MLTQAIVVTLLGGLILLFGFKVLPMSRGPKSNEEHLLKYGALFRATGGLLLFIGILWIILAYSGRLPW